MTRSLAVVNSLIPVIVDDRETRAPVLEALRGMEEFDVTVHRLTTGDYLVDKRLLFERKTLRDLIVSIQSGRLFAQALRLAESKPYRSALILEGTARELRCTGMRREAVQGALVTVSLFIGLPVLRTRNAMETAHTLLYAARQARTIADGGLARRGRRPKQKRALQLYLLQGLPGVGPTRAASLLERYGNFRAAVNADPDELASVAGIGKETARRIGWAVKERAAHYRAGVIASRIPRKANARPGSSPPP